MVKYIQGDVVGVYNSAGTKLVTFTYDAYGNCTVSGDESLAYRCKIRYRGYYFDTETGLYWVQTRYYNPQWCRWISPDSIGYLDPESAHGLNLYAYCLNNPVNYIDPSGHGIVVAIISIFGVLMLGGAIMGGVAEGETGGDVEDVLEGMAKGVTNGFMFGVSITASVLGFKLHKSKAGHLSAGYGISTGADMLSIIIYQSRKSAGDGDDFWETVSDVNNALFANLEKVYVGQHMIGSVPIKGTKLSSKSGVLISAGIGYIFENYNYNVSTFSEILKGKLMGKPGFSRVTFLASATRAIYRLIKALRRDPEESGWTLY